MKKIGLLILVFGNLCLSKAQNLISGEYYFDSFHEIGQGIPFSVTNSTNISETLAVPTTGLNSGVHNLFIRIKDSNNEWSPPYSKIIYLMPLQNNEVTIIGGEYYYDTFREPGQGIQFELPQATISNETLSFATTNLLPGVHTLFIRVKDSNQTWSQQYQKLIYVLPPVTTQSNLVAYEWSIDTDPGQGNGTKIFFSQPSAMVNTSFEINCNNITVGNHIAYVRVLDSAGNWSFYEAKTFTISPNIPQAPEAFDQTLCASSTIADLQATGTDIKWYTVPNGGAALPTNALVSSGNYYASQTVEGYESTNRTLIHLTVISTDFTTQPSNNYLCVALGSTTNLSAAVNNNNSVTYTWQRRASATSNWITINASNAGLIYDLYDTANLEITKGTSTLPANGTQYRVIVNHSCGTLYSQVASVKVISTVKSGSIIAASSVCEENAITFKLNGYYGTKIQWQSATNPTLADWTDIAGATNENYSITNIPLNAKRYYRAIVLNECQNTTATTAVKTITVNPTSVVGTVSGGATVCSAGGTGKLTLSNYVGKVQWQYSVDGGTNYLNAPKSTTVTPGLGFSTTSAISTSKTYLLTNITVPISFRAQVTSGNCNPVYSNTVSFNLSNAAQIGVTTSVNTPICSGSGTTISVTSASGTIAWFKSTNYYINPLTATWTSILNSNTLNIQTGNLLVPTAYKAIASIGGSCETAESNTVLVNFVAPPLAKTVEANTTIPSGLSLISALCSSDNSKTISEGIGYNGTIQWQVSTISATTDFSDIIGATNANYSIINPSIGANYFRAKLTNSCGVSVLSRTKVLYYKDCTPAKKEVSENSIGAYPNPFKNAFNIDISTNSSQLIQIAIYDMSGKLIEKLNTKPDEISNLNIGSNYASGLYNLMVTQGESYKAIHVLKQ